VRTLIIGGSGFIGRNLASMLGEQEHEVFVLDRVPDKTDSTGTIYITGEAQDSEIIYSALEQSDPQVVYHLAANSDISAGILDASLDFGDTLMTTIALCQALERHPVETLVFASSSAIFGNVGGPIAESIDGFLCPESWYGKAKLASEYVIEAFSHDHPQTAILITRFPNVVGPKATHGVVYDFLRKLKADPNKLQVLGNGHQEKPYVHVGDLIAGIEHFRSQAVAGDVLRVNIGPTDTLTVREIVAIVTRALELSPEVYYEEQEFGWVGDIPKYEFDATRMRDGGFVIHASSAKAVDRAVRDLIAEA